jgi:hypothetical protein
MTNRYRAGARLLAAALGASLAAWSAGAAADTVRESRTVAQPFSEVRLEGSFDLELTQSDTVSLAIESTREDLPTIRSEVRDGVLTLRREDSGALGFFRSWSHRQPARVLLSAKAIERLFVDGAGDAHVGDWKADSLEVYISGAGDVKVDRLTAVRFSCDVSGSGDVALAGSVTRQRIRLSGSADYRAPDLRSQTASVSISGSGDAVLWVERTLEARIRGSGDVRYYGTPTVTQSVSGSGSVTGLGARNAP